MNKKIIATVAIILTAAFSNVSAQTNVTTVTNVMTVTVTNIVTVTNVAVAAPAAPLTDAAPKSPWQSSASLGLTLTRGNSDTTLLTLNLLTDRKDDTNEWSFGADGSYGKNAGVENAESLHGFGQWNHLFSERFFSYLRAEGLHDGIAGVKYRATFGPGGGYYLLKGNATTLAAEAGGAMVFERLGTNDSSHATIRLAERFEHKFAAHGARVWQTIEFLPQVDHFDNYIANAEIGVEAGIAKNLSLQTYLDDSYAKEPAPGRLKNDAKLVSAISYKF